MRTSSESTNLVDDEEAKKAMELLAKHLPVAELLSKYPTQD